MLKLCFFDFWNLLKKIFGAWCIPKTIDQHAHLYAIIGKGASNGTCKVHIWDVDNGRVEWENQHLN